MCCTCLAGFEAAQGDGLALHVGGNSPYEHAAHPKGCRGLLSCCLQILQWKQGVVLLDHFWQPKLFRPPFTLQAQVELLVLLGWAANHNHLGYWAMVGVGAIAGRTVRHAGSECWVRCCEGGVNGPAGPC